MRKILVIIVLVVLVVSIFGLYMALNSIIDIWLGYKYSPIYKALLSLAVLIIAVYVLTKLIRYERDKVKDIEGSERKE